MGLQESRSPGPHLSVLEMKTHNPMFPSCFICLFFFFFFAALHSLWDLSSQPGIIKPMSFALEAWSLNHWTTREVPFLVVLKSSLISVTVSHLSFLL